MKEYEYKEFNGARLRAKVQEIEQGERCTSYFVNLEKHRANNNIMISLLTEDGTLVETQDEILKETTNFYKWLYTSEKTDVLAQDYLLNNLKQTLTDEYKDSIEGEITLKRERNVLFNDTLNTFYLRLYGVRHMVKDHSDSEKGNPLPPHRLLFPISSKGSFICIIPQTG